MAAPETAHAIVGVAQRLADDVLFPSALAADAADTVPRAPLDALADAGLYGLSGPAWAGGIDVDFDTACAVFESLAGGCLTTAFVWAQHIGAVRAAAASDSPHMRAWVEPLCHGTRRAGLALGGALPGPPQLRARRAEGGWVLTGASPWLSGWGRATSSTRRRATTTATSSGRSSTRARAAACASSGSLSRR